MIVCNSKYHTKLPFEEYLALPHYSFSGFKNNGAPIAQTQKMSMGTAVHNYLLEPEKFPHTDPYAKALAIEIKKTLGPLLQYMIPEMAVTADLLHEGFMMPYKGRIDLAIPGRLVVDLKVTGEDIKKVIPWFGYEDQISGYALTIHAKKAFIVSINTKSQKVSVVNIPISHNFWNKKILQYGMPIQ